MDISQSNFHEALDAYTTLIPPQIASLDSSRYESIPASISGLKAENIEPYLTNSQVQLLLDWKDAIQNLSQTTRVKSYSTIRNDQDEVRRRAFCENVEKATREACRCLARTNVDYDEIQNAIEVLRRLRGCNIVEASLILSVHNPAEIPYFSKELRFFWWESVDDRLHEDWKMWSVEEYLQVVKFVKMVKERFGVRASDVEKVAFVLRKRQEGREMVERRDRNHVVDEGSEDELA